MEEPLSQHVEEPLRDLQADSLDKKNRAAEQLGKLSVSSHQIVRALIAAKMCDSSYVIRKTAAESLRAPVHQEILRQNPRLMRSAQLPPDQVLAFQEDDTVPGFDSLSAAIESSLVRLDSWMIGLVYGLVLVGATAFLLKVELNLVVLAAYALVWLVGLFLGQHILRRKGYRKEAEEIVDSWANRFKGAGSGSGELGVVLLAILALFGPFLLLTALLAKPRGSLGQDKEGAVKEIRGFVPVAAACYTRAAYCGLERSLEMNLHTFARRMPKVELHVHLEGAIRPSTLLQLAQRNRVPLPAHDVEGLRDFYRFRDFSHFLEVYVTITGCLRTPEDYALIAYEFGSDCARQNIRYAEVTFTVTTNMKLTGLPWQAILEGLNSGRDQARKEFGVAWGWVFDIIRNHPETQDEVFEIAMAARDQGVLALGLGGSEAEFPPGLFERAFTRAREAGLPRVPHAGELSGPESIWTALRSLHADRLGHGVRCIEDPDLVAFLNQHQVPLELCPTSNVRLGLYRDYAAHPLRQLWDQGLWITVGSDDPPLFGTDLNREYAVLVDHFGFGVDDLEQVSLNGLRASFLPPAKQARLEVEFRAEFARLREELG